MEIPDTLYTDPRFLEVVRFLLGRREAQDLSPPEEEAPDDEVARRVRTMIHLRMKRNAKRKRV